MSTSTDQPDSTYLKNRKPESSPELVEETVITPGAKGRKVNIPSSSSAAAAAVDDEFDVSFGVLDIIRILLGLVLLSCGASYFITGESLTWNYRPEWSRWKNIRMLWTKPIYLTDEELSIYNGTDPNLPIYLSINDTIFDVTAGSSKYGPGGSYHFFAGRDATRGFVTGCFAEDITWDLRGVEDMYEGDHENPKEAVEKTVSHWVKFFKNHKDYYFVGYTVHPKDWEQTTPVRDLCEQAGGKAKREKRLERERREREEKEKSNP